MSGEGLSVPRGGGGREQLRVLLLERRGATRARTAALNQLDAVIVTAPASLRQRLDRLPKRRLVQTVARLRPRADDQISHALRRIARRIEMLTGEIQDIDRTLQAMVCDLAPDLLSECGVGPVCGAQLVSSGDASRMANEASFAALAGTSPLDASSGRQERHRLNRGGDRQLNWALHVIALQRVHHHAQTKTYYQRLLASGKTSNEAKRCVKRALARHFYRRLTEIHLAALTT